MHASPPSPAPRWPALLIWAAVWVLLLAADPWLDLSNLSLLLLTGSAAASLFLSPAWSITASTLSVIAFNWLFVPPRGSFHVDLPQHLLLLLSMVVVNGLIALLMALQRRATERSYDQRVRTALLTSLSHDFRTPLATIMGAASTLRQRFEQLSDAQKRQQSTKDVPATVAVLGEEQLARAGVKDLFQAAVLVRATRSAVLTTALIAPMPWPQPQMSFQAFLASPPKFILLGSDSGRFSGSRPAARIEGAR